ncbi:hypothetical protein [Phaeobacter sp. 22II1-1F12B]|uniref:hypothetical protein n=1 Tax=Phaeobacter sp. 22II1-1F12B TaxID=1317111 RepID=UPI001185A871|nr:hypothetical protein [Phaeobacter sp. 22II1-1F12B]
MDKTQQLHDQPCPKKGPTMLRMVTDALHASGLVPPSRPETGLPPYYNRENISDFYLEKHSGGWVANIVFRHVPPGIGNMLGSPDAHPYKDRRDAFLHGATLLSLIITGSPDLPFIVAEDTIIAFG